MATSINTVITLRAGTEKDIQSLCRLRSESIQAIPEQAYRADQLQRWAQSDISELLLKMYPHGWISVAEKGEETLGFAGVDLDHADLTLLFVSPAANGLGLGGKLIREAESIARRYGITRLHVEASLNAEKFYHHMGYRPMADQSGFRCTRANLPGRLMDKSLAGEFLPQQRKVMALLAELDIPADYGVRHRLPMQDQPEVLESIGMDILDRDQRLTPAAAKAWKSMQQVASTDDISLLPVSAFRSVDYQAELIRKKLQAGQCCNDILKFSAAPGFSEHHSGRAIDITTRNAQPLEVEFETTPAFDWLCRNAARFGFHLSYPRDNIHHIAYEPWHWCYRD